MSFSRRDAFQLAAAAGLTALPMNAAGHSERLKITRVELFKVVVPMQPDIISSPELGPDTLAEFPSIPKFIVKIRTDSGVTGVGETYRGLDEAAVRRNGASLEGKNIFDMNLTRLDFPSRAGAAGMRLARLGTRAGYYGRGDAPFVRRGRQLHAAEHILSCERVDDLIVKPIDIRESYAYPANRPGLGIELDEGAVRRYRAA